MAKQHSTCLISACLVGLCTRYDGQTKANQDCPVHIKTTDWIPVCPEQLGGLPTPREAADIIGGDGRDVLAGKARVVTKSGVDVTAAFIRGAKQVLYITRLRSISIAYLKARSPSCAVNGTIGVTAALLRSNGIEVKEL
ncbi:MAG: DUF523 domain-containing protein [Desulforhopalus sp.]